MNKKTFLVLDGNSLLHRAWHAIPPLTASDGRVVNAAYGFTNIIEKMIAEQKPDYMAVAWDLPGGTFRHELYKEYKGTREKKEQELYDQIAYIQEILAGYGIPSLSVKGMEADDILGTLAKKYGPKAKSHTRILTGDLDSLQLIDDDTEVMVFVKGLSETKTYDKNAVRERYGLNPDQLIDLKALMGDASDNIPGLSGVGKKTAEQLLQEYGSIEAIYKAIDAGKVPEKYAKKFLGQESEVEKMKTLVTIVNDVKLPGFSMKDAAVHEPNKETLTSLFRTFGFRRLLEKYEGDETRNPHIEIRNNSQARNSKSKTKPTSFVSLEELGGELTIYLDHGAQDLFGGAVRCVCVFDGKRTAKLENPTPEDFSKLVDVLAKAKMLTGHDVKAFMHVVNMEKQFGKDTVLFDTMVGAYLLSPGTRTFDLTTSVYEQLGVVVNEKTTSEEKVRLVFQLAEKLQAGLRKEKMETLWRDIEMPLIPVLYAMEREGVLLDAKKLAELSKLFEKKIDELTKRIHKLSGHEWNLNSPSQLAAVLFEDLKLPTKGIKKTKSGFSTAATELEKLWDVHAIVPLMSEYREIAKLKSTYVDTLPLLVHTDGRIHTTYDQTIAATGRLSSKDPNLQNIPIRTTLGNEIRKAFVAPRGHVILSIDYSQFELRLAASMASDTSFIQAFQEGADIHTRTASEVLDKPEAEVSKKERSAAKAINFGILYGMGERNLARSTGFSQDQARAFLDAYFTRHPQIQTYIDTRKREAHKQGYAETLFGRRRYLPDLTSGMQMLVAAGERMAVNMPIQGTQADLIKMAMLRVHAWIGTSARRVKMLLQVHDELVFEVHKDDVDQVVPELVRIMEGVWKSDVPLVVDAEVGKNWGELHAWKEK